MSNLDFGFSYGHYSLFLSHQSGRLWLEKGSGQRKVGAGERQWLEKGRHRRNVGTRQENRWSSSERFYPMRYNSHPDFDYDPSALPRDLQ
jgi:hypothetical protein